MSSLGSSFLISSRGLVSPLEPQGMAICRTASIFLNFSLVIKATSDLVPWDKEQLSRFCCQRFCYAGPPFSGRVSLGVMAGCLSHPDGSPKRGVESDYVFIGKLLLDLQRRLEYAGVDVIYLLSKARLVLSSYIPMNVVHSRSDLVSWDKEQLSRFCCRRFCYAGPLFSGRVSLGALQGFSCLLAGENDNLCVQVTRRVCMRFKLRLQMRVSEAGRSVVS
ncbi:hypothetical protein HID58_022615 [Brassica napus]|uniref:Uncharacterized protein n=1 Tax=Brassica napus TaxID=3708 RepID=A0ABQ8D0P7_BRANA|nr:hypothetical protein HID58_022615 [Brassica napus]